VKVVFGKPSGDFEYVITWRGGARLWLPEPAPELVLLKGLSEEAALAGSTALEALAAVSARRWRELYALARFVDYEGPPEPPAVMWYADLDLAVAAARGLSEEAEVLLEVPELGSLHAALLAGCNVTVCVSGPASVAGADSVVWKPRAAARAALRSIGLLGGTWGEVTLPKLESSREEWEPRSGEAIASFERYEPPAAPRSLPEPRELDPLLDIAFGEDADAAFALLRDVAAGPLPLRSVPELGQYAPLLRDLVAYGYAAVERDVVRLTEKGLYALLQKMGGAGGETG
jgi:hypothetical protein